MILVCGDTILDVLRDPDQARAERPARFVAHPGGSPANTAVAIARLGGEVGLCARLAGGGVGALLREHLERNQVDLRYCVVAREPASLAVVDVGAGGSAQYAFYVEGAADWAWTADELPRALGEDVEILHTGSIAALRAPGAAAIAEFVEREAAARLCSFDPNIRPQLLGPVAEVRAATERLVAAVHLVKASDEDLAWLYPGRPTAEVARSWLGLGATVVVVTAGSSKITAFFDGGEILTAPRPVSVVDTVGAGDTFSAALLHHLASRRLGAALARRSIDGDELRAALDYAAGAAALACTKAGANPPSAQELESFLSEPR